MLVQLLALLSAIAGIVLAVLAFGWKDVPGMPLYLPHKWFGVAVIAMAVLQVRMGHAGLCKSCFSRQPLHTAPHTLPSNPPDSSFQVNSWCH